MAAPRTDRLALAAALAAIVLTAGCGGGDDGDGDGRPQAKPQPQPAPGLAQRQPAAPGAPNVVVVMTDDQSLASFTPRYMPHTFRDIVRPGTRMTTGLAAPPLCCPARAGFLTGQYPHNHGVFSNDMGYLQLESPEQVLPVWLQRAGYVTGFVGKPLNGYNRLGSTSAAPGFDHWFANFGGRATYYDYDIAEDGKVRHYGTETSDYLTDVLSGLGLDFISEASKGKRPFFLWLAQYAPHRHAPPEEVAERIPSCANSVPTPRTEAEYQRYADEPLPTEARPTTRPTSPTSRARSQRLPRIDPEAEGFVEERWRCTLAAIRTLDKTVGDLVDHLRELGELNDTVIVYLSDNGYFFGEHRLATGKGWYYREASEVPFAIRVPPRLRGGAPAVAQSDELVANIDLAPDPARLRARHSLHRRRRVPRAGRPLAARAPGRRGGQLSTAAAPCSSWPAAVSPTRRFAPRASSSPSRARKPRRGASWPRSSTTSAATRRSSTAWRATRATARSARAWATGSTG